MNRDPGLQPERTRLAWRRTALHWGIVAVLTVRMSFPLGRSGALASAAALLTWATGVAVANRRGRRMADRRPTAAGRSLVVVAILTAGYAALGVVLVATSLG
jgi:Domain of unknown function (DUF202)